jgi:hypothetical protein
MPPHSVHENASEALGIPSLPAAFAAPSERLLPWLIAVTFFMESLDSTILNTGVPTIEAALDVAPLSMKSVLGGERQFYYPARYRGNSVFVSVAVPSGIGVLTA